jgi:protease-4
VRELADGRAYTGRQALPLGLVDAIGDETTSRAWLAKEKDVSAALPVEDVSTSGFAGRALAGTLGPLLDGLWKMLVSQSLTLDGAWALWQRPKE